MFIYLLWKAFNWLWCTTFRAVLIQMAWMSGLCFDPRVVNVWPRTEFGLESRVVHLPTVVASTCSHLTAKLISKQHRHSGQVRVSGEFFCGNHFHVYHPELIRSRRWHCLSEWPKGVTVRQGWWIRPPLKYKQAHTRTIRHEYLSEVVHPRYQEFLAEEGVSSQYRKKKLPSKLKPLGGLLIHKLFS